MFFSSDGAGDRAGQIRRSGQTRENRASGTAYDDRGTGETVRRRSTLDVDGGGKRDAAERESIRSKIHRRSQDGRVEGRPDRSKADASQERRRPVAGPAAPPVCPRPKRTRKGRPERREEKYPELATVFF